MLELFAEVEDFLGAFAGLTIFEKRLAIFELADVFSSRIEAQRKIVAVLVQPSKHERVTTDIGRNVNLLGDSAFIVAEGVYAIVEAHQCQRHGIGTGGKHDRHVTLCLHEFIDCQRDGMLLGKPWRLGHRTRAIVRMVLAVERHEVFEKQGQVGLRRAGHGSLRNSVGLSTSRQASVRSGRFTVLARRVQAARVCQD